MTFSIVARDPERNLFGVAVSTAVPCVGAVCTYAKAGVGAIASQSYVNARLGSDGLRLLELGLSPEAALTSLLQEDPEAAKRQAAGIDSRGRVFAYSGDECVDWYGHRTGENYTVQGNMLVGKETIDAMAEAFERSQGHESAALLVPAPTGEHPWAGVDIRVDQHPDPVAELRRIFDLLHERRRQALEELQREQGEG